MPDPPVPLRYLRRGGAALGLAVALAGFDCDFLRLMTGRTPSERTLPVSTSCWRRYERDLPFIVSFCTNSIAPGEGCHKLEGDGSEEKKKPEPVA